MYKVLGILRARYKVLILLICCAAAAWGIGFWYGRYYVETGYSQLAERLYHGQYYVELSYTGAGGQEDSILLSSMGFRSPRRDSEGNQYVRQSMPFIERTEIPYDISYFALTDGESSRGFDFTFVDSPQPYHILVQRWPRSQQGTEGKFTNGEPVAFEAASEPMKYHVSEFEPGYIYSIYASWGPYYGEYACLASADEKERVYWKLDDVTS